MKKKISADPKMKVPGIGMLLVAQPMLPPLLVKEYPYVKRSVILIVQHNEVGTIGLILNRITKTTVPEIMTNFPSFDVPAYYGGPKTGKSLFYLHTFDNKKLPKSIEIGNEIYWQGDFETLKMLIEAGEVPEDKIHFVVGSCHWSADELTKDLQDNLFFVEVAKKEYVFCEDYDKLWGNVLKDTGHPYGIMKNFPVDPEFN